MASLYVESAEGTVRGKVKGKYENRKNERTELTMDAHWNGVDWTSYPERSRSQEKKEYNEGIVAGDTRRDIWILRFW